MGDILDIFWIFCSSEAPLRVGGQKLALVGEKGEQQAADWMPESLRLRLKAGD